MSRWFRFYDDAINDPKILKLSDELHRAWVGLLCIASKSNGQLPPIDDIALLLRVKPHKAAEFIARLTKAGLIDEFETGFTPHNWNGRQYKSDVSTERVKRFRNGKRNVSETPPDTEQIQIQKDDGGGNAREASISQAAIRLADTLAEICGHGTDPKAFPLAWHGAPMRVQTWLNEGWPVEIITATVREVVGRKADGAPESVSYFEKPIAKAIAKQAKPLPKVQIIQGETVDVVQATNAKSASAAGVRILERLRNLNVPAARERLSGHAGVGTPAAEGGGGIRDGASDFAPRLLSQG